MSANPARRWPSLNAWVAGLVTMAAVAALFLLDPVVRGFRYPVGWDAPYYVWRTAAVPVDGLARLGAVRSGSALLFAQLMRATGQNAFTIVSVLPPILAGVVALAAAAMLRSALGTGAWWTPVVGWLTWAGFGRVGILNGHFDQLLNAALVMGALAAAVAFAAGGKGPVAVGVLLAGAGLAEWPFWAFGVAILVLGLAVFAWPALRGGDSVRPLAAPLLAAAGASAVFTGLTFLVHPPGGRIGPALSRPSLRRLLRRRFLARVRDPLRYIAFLLAGAGGVAAAREPVALPGASRARRLFVSLMIAWVAVTVVAGIAQAAGLPVAGARLTSYLFAVPILAAVLVWWLARWLAARRPGPAGLAAAIIVVLAAVGGFGAMAWVTGRTRIPYFERAGVRQAAAAGAYVGRFASDRQVAYLVVNPNGDGTTGGRWWHVTQAALPPEVVPRAERFVGPPGEFLSEHPDATAIVLERYNRKGFREALADGSGMTVAPGVVALNGPPGRGPPTVAPQADLRARTLAWLLPALVAMLFAVGSGWSVALLPGDAVVRMGLAPALGAAVLSLGALGWERLGLGFSTWEALVVAAIAASAGWVAAFVPRRRTSVRSGGSLRR